MIATLRLHFKCQADGHVLYFRHFGLACLKVDNRLSGDIQQFPKFLGRPACDFAKGGQAVLEAADFVLRLLIHIIISYTL